MSKDEIDSFEITKDAFGSIDALVHYAERNSEWNPYYGNYRWHKLHVAAAATGFNEDVPWHRALGDTIACQYVRRHLVRNR